MTHEDFVTFEQAKSLKELGFDWECRAVYLFDSSYDNNGFVYGRGFWVMDYNKTDEGYSAPTLYQAQKWLREVKKVDITITLLLSYSEAEKLPVPARYYNPKLTIGIYEYKTIAQHCTYEGALLEGIRVALELLKKSGK